MRSRSRSGDSRAQVNRLNRELTAISTEQARLDATLRQPANASILERSLLLNTLVERKSVSWTRIFADLEAVMPPNVRLTWLSVTQVSNIKEGSYVGTAAVSQPDGITAVQRTFP